MADVFSRKRRSEIMSLVKSRENSATELRLIKVFREYGITGWRRRSRLFGKPDFVFPTVGVAIFVDGCFWHNCPIHGEIPKTNRQFWTLKIERNVSRDQHVRRQLRKQGWTVIRIWQHNLSKKSKRHTASRVVRYLNAKKSRNFSRS